MPCSHISCTYNNRSKLNTTLNCDTVFHAWRNHQGEVVVVAGVCLFCINRWFGFTLYTLKHSEEGWEFPDH